MHICFGMQLCAGGYMPTLSTNFSMCRLLQNVFHESKKVIKDVRNKNSHS